MGLVGIRGVGVVSYLLLAFLRTQPQGNRLVLEVLAHVPINFIGAIWDPD